MSRFPLRQPPRALRAPAVTVDNISIVPGSVMPYKATYQALANQLPKGGVLIVFPSPTHREYQTLTKVKALFEAKGHRVTTMTTDQADSDSAAMPVRRCVV